MKSLNSLQKLGSAIDSYFGQVYCLETGFDIVEQFLTSWNQGDLHTLIALMAEDVTFWSDGGGQVTEEKNK